MKQEDVQVVLAGYRLKVDVMSALGFIVANHDVAVDLFGEDFYTSCEHKFRNSYIE